MKILLVGMNHRSAPVELRERLAVEDLAPPLRKLVSGGEVDEAVLLSTCNRVEVVALSRTPDAARDRLHSFFRRDLGDGNLPVLSEHLYEFADSEAVRHVLRVASALDSMVIGEPQILGQAKDAYRAALECGACGPILGRLYQTAFATAKRVRTETRIAERPVSVARVAVELARQIFDELEDKRALLVGAGEMIEAALAALRGAGLGSVRVANRTRERAEDLAARFGSTAHGLDELPGLVADADIILTCIGGDRPILTREHFDGALRARRNRPIFVIDLGVPRNAESEINAFENVYLYDIDDLGSVADDNARERTREAVRGEEIVAEQQQRFDGWFAALRAVPTIRHLRSRVESIRGREVERTLGRLGLAASEEEAVEALTRSIVNKILHAPLSRLRQEAEREEGMVYLEAARALFDLDDGDESGEG
ncbi:MAG: glutamyl-tRNA reductase [Myxococcales bacterium]|nr:glutamyl-tRNA reductase [Myxococcales bacterium]